MLHCRTASHSLRLGGRTRCCALASNNPSDRPCTSRRVVREFKEQTRSRLRVFGVACEVRIAPQKKLARLKVATPKRSCQCHRPNALEVREQAHQDDVVGCGPLANNSAKPLNGCTHVWPGDTAQEEQRSDIRSARRREHARRRTNLCNLLRWGVWTCNFGKLSSVLQFELRDRARNVIVHVNDKLTRPVGFIWINVLEGVVYLFI